WPLGLRAGRARGRAAGRRAGADPHPGALDLRRARRGRADGPLPARTLQRHLRARAPGWPVAHRGPAPGRADPALGVLSSEVPTSEETRSHSELANSPTRNWGCGILLARPATRR